MNDRLVQPLGGTRGLDAVRGTAPGQRAAWPERSPVQVPERPLPGVHEFDRQELTGGSAVQQAYAKFTVDQRTGVTSIKIIDAATDTVIREIPPERVIKIVQELQSYLAARQQRGG
jgi:hypothetical protein